MTQADSYTGSRCHVSTNRELTSYLKGIAILCVVSGHFSQRFMPAELPTYGNHLIAVFFLLSGFGLYHSLKKSDASCEPLFQFYLKRFLRIFPLYWVSFFIDLGFDSSATFSRDMVYDFFLINFTDPPRVWFLHALIPCYVFAPAVYNLIRKYGLRSLYIFIGVFTALNIIMPAMDAPDVRCWIYRDIYFSEYFLFCVGMLFPLLKEAVMPSQNRIYLALLFIVMMISAALTTEINYFPDVQLDIKTAISIIFIFTTTAFVYLFIFNSTLTLPFKKTLCRIGAYTYSIYLFEGMFATALYDFNIISGKYLVNGLIFAVFFPLFFMFCVFIENLSSNGYILARRVFISRPAVSIQK
ncbi:acyltransferase [Oceanidesulfovibrio marinus]|uniref:Acyltransferase n=1 Tax=Oceanidesulfovibrio marinus TaxID=370038 RepID=A0ABX6ND89_9BACT|nr:acyltransferase [Oceanidesulfovibrio marinus]